LECFGFSDNSALRIRKYTPAIEDQFILASYEVAVSDGATEFFCTQTYYLLPFFDFTYMEWRSRDIQNHLNFVERSEKITEPINVPNIKTDGQSDIKAIEIDNEWIIACGKVSLLVEDTEVW
jgi:hypothetical protein